MANGLIHHEKNEGIPEPALTIVEKAQFGLNGVAICGYARQQRSTWLSMVCRSAC